MAYDVYKGWLNCKVDFNKITLSNVKTFAQDCNNTVPAIFVHNKFKNTCYYKLGNIASDVSCDKKGELPGKALVKQAIARYITDHPEVSKASVSEEDLSCFARIQLEKEMCHYYPEPGPESGIPVVMAVAGVVSVGVVCWALYNVVCNYMYHD